MKNGSGRALSKSHCVQTTRSIVLSVPSVSKFLAIEDRVEQFSDHELSRLLLSLWLFSSVYQIVVEEERPRRAKKTTEILKCYPVPIHFQNVSLLNSQYYFAAEFPADSLQAAQPFTIGDNRTYNGYWNTPLLPHKSYRIYYQAASRANGVSVGDVYGLGSFLMVFM